MASTIDTVPTAATPVETIISMMVGRQLFEQRSSVHAPTVLPREVVLEVRGLNRGRTRSSDVSFQVRTQRRDPGFRRPHGRGRTEVARAVFGADPIESGEMLVRGREGHSHPARRQDAVQHGIGYLSEDRKHFGLATGMDVESNIALADLRRFLSPGAPFLNDARPSARLAASFVKQLGIKTPSVTQTVRQAALGRQPAENRDRQMAGAGLRNPVFR